jgi:hypothetical protein
MSPAFDRDIAEAILGIDTLWGGDALSASGAGRFIADSWFSDAPMPRAYTHPTAARLRETGGVSGATFDRGAIDAYLQAVDVRGAIDRVATAAGLLGGLRGAYVAGLADCFLVMWDLVQERLGNSGPVPYERCVRASTGAEPTPSNPTAHRERVAALLASVGHPSRDVDSLLRAADAWRRERIVPAVEIPVLADRIIAALDALTVRNVVPHLPRELRSIPRANIRFLPIENAWFSGSMNYLGRARRPDGTPEYEATYELNASLEISEPEFQQLVSHEVVPGHVMTVALLQALYVRGTVGFESSVLTLNTRCATLFEGIANNGILMAHGVTEIDALPDPHLQIGMLLALLQDDAKNQASYLTWKESVAQPEVASVLRRDYLVSEERAQKFSGPWGRHPLLGRMMLPSYRAGTELVARLRREHPPEKVLPAMFGCQGLVDSVTLEMALAN